MRLDKFLRVVAGQIVLYQKTDFGVVEKYKGDVCHAPTRFNECEVVLAYSSDCIMYVVFGGILKNE